MTTSTPSAATHDHSPPVGEEPPAGVPTAPRRSRGAGVRRLVVGLLVPVTLVALWEVAGRQQWLGGGLVPPASTAVESLVDFIFGGSDRPSVYSGEWAEHVGASSVRILLGYAIGALLAVLLGLAAGFFLTVRQAIDPTINALRPISITAWIPLTLILFGIGNKPAVFLTGLATFYPVYVSTFLGARFVDGNLVRAARMLGARRWHILRRVTLPATLPSIVSGLRVALALAWTTVVVAEILGAKSGIGYVLIDSYKQFRFDYVIACMITLGAAGFLSDRLVALIFSRPLRWAHLNAKE